MTLPIAIINAVLALEPQEQAAILAIAHWMRGTKAPPLVVPAPGTPENPVVTATITTRA
jgi:hypothetical protein